MRMRLVFKLYFAIDSEGKCDSKGTTSEKHSWSKFETMFQKLLSWMRCIIAPLEVFLGTKVNFLSVLGKSIQIEYSKWQWQVNKSTMISRCVNLLPCFLRLHQRPPIFKSVFVASPSFSRVPPSLPCQWSSSTATTWTTMPSQLTTSPRLWWKAGHCMDNRICLFLNIRHLSLASAFVTSWVMSPSSCIPEWKCRKQQTHLKRVKARFCWEIKEYKTSLDSCIHYFILGALKSTSWLDPNPIDPTDLDKCAMAFFPVQQLSSCRTAGREPEEFFTVGLPQGNHLWEVVQSPTSWKLRGSSDQRKTGRELWIKHLKESGMTEKMLQLQLQCFAAQLHVGFPKYCRSPQFMAQSGLFLMTKTWEPPRRREGNDQNIPETKAHRWQAEHHARASEMHKWRWTAVGIQSVSPSVLTSQRLDSQSS